MAKKKQDNKEQETKQENKLLKFLKNFFNSWQPLLIVLILVIVGLLMFIIVPKVYVKFFLLNLMSLYPKPFVTGTSAQ